MPVLETAAVVTLAKTVAIPFAKSTLLPLAKAAFCKAAAGKAGVATVSSIPKAAATVFSTPGSAEAAHGLAEVTHHVVEKTFSVATDFARGAGQDALRHAWYGDDHC